MIAYRLREFPTTLWLVSLRNEISPLRFAAVEMTMKWSKHLCQTVSCKPNDCPALYLPGLMSCFCPSRQTGIYRLWCHYRRLPRFFAGAQNDLSGGLSDCLAVSCLRLPIRRPVFIGFCATIGMHQDSSLAPRMTSPAGV